MLERDAFISHQGGHLLKHLLQLIKHLAQLYQFLLQPCPVKLFLQRLSPPGHTALLQESADGGQRLRSTHRPGERAVQALHRLYQFQAEGFCIILFLLLPAGEGNQPFALPYAIAQRVVFNPPAFFPRQG